MKRKLSTALVTLVIFALVISFTAITASAANTPTNGQSINFSKYMVVKNTNYIPTTTITFAINPGTPINATAQRMAVYAGPTAAGQPTVGTVSFSPSDTTYTTVQAGDDVVITADEKYAKKTAAVDLTGVTFTEPGVYRYELTEVSATDPAVGIDARTLYLDVYITSDNAGVLTFSSTVLHTDPAAPLRNATSGSNDVATANAAMADKVTGFTDHYPTRGLTFSKAVSGNQASRDKYFAFTVTLGGLTAGNEYSVDYTTGGADSTITAKPNAATTIAALNGSANYVQPAKITVPAGATSVTETFYLHDGQSIRINGLPDNTTYTVLEAEEDYTPAVVVTGDKDASDNIEAVITDNHQASGTFDANDDDIGVAFTNTRDGIIPTGVIMAVAPFAIGLCLFGAVIIFIISKRRRQNCSN